MINFMMFVIILVKTYDSQVLMFHRFSNCSKRDLDSWELLGNKGWNWEAMQPFYRKFETFNAPPEALGQAMGSGYIEPKLRGTDGPIQTSFCESISGWQEKTWIETCKNAGYPEICDPRRGVSLGAYNQLMCIDPKTKTRSYSYTGYIEPNLGRVNLKILTNAKASKILLSKDGDEAVATGVQFFVDGKRYTVAARNEVICSAGSIQTPQILELSGIGDRSLLEKHGIEVVVENPTVGTNLQDHPLCPISYVSSLAH
jgi:choline dehydrogenase-like flavoprotein